MPGITKRNQGEAGWQDHHGLYGDFRVSFVCYIRLIAVDLSILVYESILFRIPTTMSWSYVLSLISLWHLINVNCDAAVLRRAVLEPIKGGQIPYVNSCHPA